ncbi:invasion associated locus B family protein [Endozoicomonas acroporae]|uniref:invasion associated locus B family protein n=1 Tax=Endozoicomonas acroporae TaxID=1701104 RepID=UPI000C767510|nr:invasion associated locus B family protein [Endozoicomonas acroporae]
MKFLRCLLIILLFSSQITIAGDFNWLNFSTVNSTGKWAYVKEQRENGYGAGYSIWNAVRVGTTEKNDNMTFFSLQKLNCDDYEYVIDILIATNKGEGAAAYIGYPGWFDVDGKKVSKFIYASERYNHKDGAMKDNITVLRIEMKTSQKELISALKKGTDLNANMIIAKDETVELKFSLQGATKALNNYTEQCLAIKNKNKSRKASKLM